MVWIVGWDATVCRMQHRLAERSKPPVHDKPAGRVNPLVANTLSTLSGIPAESWILRPKRRNSRHRPSDRSLAAHLARSRSVRTEYPVEPVSTVPGSRFLSNVDELCDFRYRSRPFASIDCRFDDLERCPSLRVSQHNLCFKTQLLFTPLRVGNGSVIHSSVRNLVSLGSLTTSLRGISIAGKGDNPFGDIWEFRSESSAIDPLFELQPYWITGSCIMAIERTRELRRRRHRKAKLINLKKRAEKASKSEKAVIATKIRRITPGAEQLIAAWKLV